MLELLQRLVAQVRAIDEEQHAARAAELDQAVDATDRCVRLPTTGGHLDEGARAVVRQRLLQVANRGCLGLPKTCLVDGRQVLQASAQNFAKRVWRFCRRCAVRAGSEPVREGFWAMEGEDLSAAGLRVEQAGEARFSAGALVQKRQWLLRGRYVIGQPTRVLFGLHLDAGEGFALLLRFDHAHGVAVDLQQVVGRTVAWLQQELAYGNAAGGLDIDGFRVLHGPARQGERIVDALAGGVLGFHHREIGCTGRRAASCASRPRVRAEKSLRSRLTSRGSRFVGYEPHSGPASLAHDVSVLASAGSSLRARRLILAGFRTV